MTKEPSQALRPPQSGHAGGRRTLFGAVCLVVAVAASLGLALQHWQALSLPGCGPGSACDRAAASVWGRLPGLGWPTSHVGTSFFLAFLAAWLVSGGRLSTRLRWLARGGLLVSVGLIGAMWAGDLVCGACLAVHAANLGFVVASEGGSRSEAARPAWAFVLTFLASTVALLAGEAWLGSAARERDEADLASSTARLLAGAEGAGLTGRYRLGPDPARVRVVVFTDYQCPDCLRIEGDLQELVAQHPDVSLAVKHFPFSPECNRLLRDRRQNPHPNACRAARAAEGAGILGGAEGFWAMHRWLFARDGAFTDEELRRAATDLGLDPVALLREMRAPRTAARVEADVEEAIALGLYVTPTVFINGVELRGWRAPRAVARAVEALLAQGIAPASARADRPPAALEKALDDWRAEGRRRLNLPTADRWLRADGRERAPVKQIVVWGDYLDEPTRELDRRIRAALPAGMGYAFRPFPADAECNPATNTRYPGACLVARAAEAAGRLGGDEAFWAMHARAMEIAPPVSEEELVSVATELGLDARAFQGQLRSSATASTVRDRAAAATDLGLHAIPFWFVNGRRVPRWRIEGVDAVERILEEAVRE